METLVKIIGFIIIWGCTLGATYIVWINFGWIIGALFFLFGAGLAGGLGMIVYISVLKLCGIDIEDL